MDEFRVIPGYNNYSVNEFGIIKSIPRDSVLYYYVLNDYLVVDVHYESPTSTLPVHRAVALAWVENPEPGIRTVVNHKSGDSRNNHYSNLEWVTVSQNNYHAIASNLRGDNVPCKVRDFHTGEITNFASIAQATEFMGMYANASVVALFPKQFGRLVNDRYEFKYQDDNTPWFYETRKNLISPSRYQVTIEEDGITREIYSKHVLLKEFQLYDSDSKAIPALVAHAQKKFPEKKFTCVDGYAREIEFKERKIAERVQTTVYAQNGNSNLKFDSLSKAAKHFKVDRSSIQNRLDNGKTLEGWTFVSSLTE